jgi:AhpD family alkylhydroperoxidase
MNTSTIHPDSGKTLAALEANIGFIPNLAAAIAASPTALKGFVGLQTALRGSTPTGLEREVVAITVSRHNDCAYSLAAHSTVARRQGGDEALIAALVAGARLADERLHTLRAFTEGQPGGGRFVHVDKDDRRSPGKAPGRRVLPSWETI